MQSTVTQGNQAQVLIRSIGEWSSRFFADKVEMPEELGHWRPRGKERWHFVLTEAGRVQAEVLRDLYETADQSWLAYSSEHRIRCPASVFRDGFANGVAATGVESRRAGRLREVTNAWICEDCEAIFIGEYFSADECSKTGLGITLCESCCDAANERAANERAANERVERAVTQMLAANKDGKIERVAKIAAHAEHVDVEANALARELVKGDGEPRVDPRAE